MIQMWSVYGLLMQDAIFPLNLVLIYVRSSCFVYETSN